MSRSKAIKKVMAYVYMPLLFCLVGIGILYFSLKPFALQYLALYNRLTVYDSPQIQNIFEDKSKEELTAEDTVDEKLVQMPTTGMLYAKFEIASASISADLYFGDSSAVLKKGLGQYIGSSIPGYGKPILISGHNNGAFNHLQYVNTGDTVTITTNYGVYEYKVTGHLIASQTDKTAYDLSQQKEQLIFYTCYPFDTLGLTNQRFFVYADKVSGPAIVSGSQS